ncbi:MAG TPA: cytoplasmic protein, partial [bacterium]|nr:cytoplasmic protein [bacterium]
MWDPDDEYWGEDDRPLDPWEREIIACGPRPLFEMEQVLPGDAIDDPFNDPIIRAVDLKNNGDASAAYDILTELCRADLRCLDAHAHLGNFKF